MGDVVGLEDVGVLDLGTLGDLDQFGERDPGEVLDARALVADGLGGPVAIAGEDVAAVLGQEGFVSGHQLRDYPTVRVMISLMVKGV